MHYRHIKKILRAPRALTRAEFSKLMPVNWEDKASFKMFMQMTDNLEAHAIRLPGINYKDWCNHYKVIINPYSWNPTIWFVIFKAEIDYAIGVDFNKLMEILIHLKAKECVQIGGTSEVFLYKTYAEHLKWQLEQKGVKYAKSTFRFPFLYSYEYQRARCEMARLIALFIESKSKQFNKFSLCKNRLSRM